MDSPYKLAAVLLLLNLVVAYVRRSPEPITLEKIAEDGGKYVQLPDGRILEYFVYGSTEPDAEVIVEFNGYGGTAKRLSIVGDSDYKRLGIKGIGITIPGFGYSTVHPSRKIGNWATDVKRILEEESVDKFVVRGQSFGSGHAMTVAHHFQEDSRCKGLILLVPLISNREQDEVGVYHKARYLSRLLHIPFIVDLVFFFISGSTMQRFSPAVTKMADEGFNVSTYLSDLDRSRVHTHLGWKYNLETMISEYHWGFHPRDIRLPRVTVMYATDDAILPPRYGEWLAQTIPKAKAVLASGYGHMTYQKLNHLVVEEIKTHFFG
mmetsp:Transcript_3881/g.4729  ORF Transcript_3881/g.4729 Transcript_3881/m.4729 type:complete len:321 (-) Transcript_3881:42-1004(-)|eukprot:CAMPEP_0184035578 /NCGR_PEP_ID=MMETSP0955-20130417/26961_1 /TAXON_ID=627963 /ORGANISM="Aplanochytrium sp, Strain PBS07" /LENGTH=320 /DNA_ID=CAMNT_0026322801 /DNA_START=57 /DNA_END=1019 /DNA_ORIENTATION=+